MKIVRSLDIKLWADFVDNHSKSNIFHTPQMFEVFAHTIGHHPQLWAAVDDKQQVLALLLPVEITLMGGILRFFTGRTVLYGSILAAENNKGQEALALVLKTYTQAVGKASLFTELRNLADLQHLQPTLATCGFI